MCKTIHPSGKTLSFWLSQAGFREVFPSHNGGAAAAKLFDQYSDKERPSDLSTIDELIQKLVKVTIDLKAPIDIDPIITAVK